MRAKVRDTEIYFDVDGAGRVPEGATMRQRPVAFLSHGGPGADHTGFKPALAPLAAHMQLVYFDHRGHGRSARGDPVTYTLDDNVEDLEALRCYLGLGPIVSIGSSYGSKVAMAHAACYPHAVSHLVIVAAAAHGGSLERAKQIVAERGTPEQRRVCEALWTGTFKDAEEVRRYYEVMAPLYSRRYDPVKTALAVARAIYEPEPMNRAFSGFLRNLDLRPELGRITAPTLVMAGRHDWICPPEFSEEIARLIPGAEMRIFENSSHTIRADEPQALIDAIAGFVVGTG